MLLGVHWISYVEPAGMTSPCVGLVITSKPSVWARTAVEKATNAAATEKRILYDIVVVLLGKRE